MQRYKIKYSTANIVIIDHNIYRGLVSDIIYVQLKYSKQISIPTIPMIPPIPMHSNLRKFPRLDGLCKSLCSVSPLFQCFVFWFLLLYSVPVPIVSV